MCTKCDDQSKEQSVCKCTPDWVLRRAFEEFEKAGASSALHVPKGMDTFPSGRALCAVIERYEKPPVSAQLVLARKIYASQGVLEAFKSKCAEGVYDKTPPVLKILEVLTDAGVFVHGI